MNIVNLTLLRDRLDWEENQPLAPAPTTAMHAALLHPERVSWWQWFVRRVWHVAQW